MTRTRSGAALEDRTASTGVTAVHLHLPYFDPALEDRAVAELARDLPVAEWFYLRYWQRGPHLRVRALTPACGDRLWRATVRAAAVAGRAARPQRALDQAGYAAAVAETAAAGEAGRPLEVLDLLAPGCYPWVYVPEFDRYGGPSVHPSVLAYFAISSGRAASMVGRVDAGMAAGGVPANHRLSAALDEVLRFVVDLTAEWGSDEAHRTVLAGHRFWSERATPQGVPEARVVDRARAVLDRLARAGAPGPLRRGYGRAPALARALADLPAQQRSRVLVSVLHTHANRLGCGGPAEALVYAIALEALEEWIR
ncbi:lantibiotic dehydratase C-terminal domain-containing protein [Tsukamurella sp. NPDC003166]|uniref:lantibiotic dehydratase C-terminal domain-containing protein n=1 Tax=Tsukamurella sp. NPDC003166 TaxID=3154444 RepID=UPI0033B4AF64